MYWAKSIHHDWRDLRGLCAQSTSDGGYIILGGVDKSLLHQLGNRIYLPGQFLLVKLDPNGDLSWAKTWPEPAFWWCYPICVCEAEGGGFVAAGNRILEYGGGYQVVVVKFSAAGNLEWQTTLTRQDTMPWIYAMATGAENRVLISGLARPLGGVTRFDQDAWLVCLDGYNGKIDWQKAYHLGGKEYATAIIPSRAGGFVLVGNIESTVTYPKPNPSPFFSLLLDNQGAVVGQRDYFLPDGIGELHAVTQLDDESCVIVGDFSIQDNHSSLLALRFHFNDRKTYRWAWHYDIYYQGPKRQTFGKAVCQTADGEIAAAGSINTDIYFYPSLSGFGFNYGHYKHALLLKLAQDGDPLWARLYGGTNTDQFTCAQAFNDGKQQYGILLSGTNESFPPFATPPAVAGERIWLMKLDSGGSTSYNMSCMEHWAAYEKKVVVVNDPKLTTVERNINIEQQELAYEEAELHIKEYFLCP